MDLFKLIERSTSATAVIWMLPVGATCTLSLVPVSQLGLVRFSIKMRRRPNQMSPVYQCQSDFYIAAALDSRVRPAPQARSQARSQTQTV